MYLKQNNKNIIYPNLLAGEVISYFKHVSYLYSLSSIYLKKKSNIEINFIYNAYISKTVLKKPHLGNRIHCLRKIIYNFNN